MDPLRLSLRPRNSSWIWIRYIQYATTGTTLCHPQNWLCRCDALFHSRHLALISPLGHFNGDNARLSPKFTRRTKSRWLQSLFPPTANKTFAKLRRTPSLARPTIRAAFSTFSLLHFVSLLTTFPTRLVAQKQTLFSMLQIKSIPKNTFRLRTSWTFSFIYLTTISESLTTLSEETTQRKYTQTRHNFTSSLKTTFPR